MPAWLEILIAGALIILLMVASFALGQAVTQWHLARLRYTSRIRVCRRRYGDQTLFRLTHSTETLGTIYDSGWRPVSEHLMPEDAPDISDS